MTKEMFEAMGLYNVDKWLDKADSFGTRIIADKERLGAGWRRFLLQASFASL